MSEGYIIGDGRRVKRGDLVDWNGMYKTDVRTRGRIIVIGGDGAWVQFAELAEPCKYPLHQLFAPSVPPFRSFMAERRDGDLHPKSGEPTHAFIARLMEAVADYADEIRKSLGRGGPSVAAMPPRPPLDKDARKPGDSEWTR